MQESAPFRHDIGTLSTAPRHDTPATGPPEAVLLFRLVPACRKVHHSATISVHFPLLRGTTHRLQALQRQSCFSGLFRHAGKCTIPPRYRYTFHCSAVRHTGYRPSRGGPAFPACSGMQESAPLLHETGTLPPPVNKGARHVLTGTLTELCVRLGFLY